jgi:hypothetical protein
VGVLFRKHFDGVLPQSFTALCYLGPSRPGLCSSYEGLIIMRKTVQCELLPGTSLVTSVPVYLSRRFSPRRQGV